MSWVVVRSACLLPIGAGDGGLPVLQPLRAPLSRFFRWEQRPVGYRCQLTPEEIADLAHLRQAA